MIGFWYRFWTFFFEFWSPKEIQNGSKIDHKSRTWGYVHWDNGFWKTTWIQNDPKWSQGLQKYPQNDPQRSKIDPQTTPRAPKTTLKWSLEPQNRPQTSPRTSFAVSTSHFSLYTFIVTQYSPAVCAKRLNTQSKHLKPKREHTLQYPDTRKTYN